MEESIKILEEMIESAEKSINRLEDNDLSGTMRGVLELRKRQTQSLLNIINKNKEQEKIIELMAESIADSGIFSDSCQSKIEADECCDTCEKCIKDYFKKKASEWNG